MYWKTPESECQRLCDSDCARFVKGVCVAYGRGEGERSGWRAVRLVRFQAGIGIGTRNAANQLLTATQSTSLPFLTTVSNDLSRAVSVVGAPEEDGRGCEAN